MFLIWCYGQPFFKSYGFHLVLWIDSSHLFDNFTHTHPHNIFPSFSPWGSHNHFVGVRYMIRGTHWREHCLFWLTFMLFALQQQPTLLVFSFLNRWYTYSRSYIRCGSCVFIIAREFINIKSFGVAIEVCSLVSLGVGPLYITSSWLSYSQFGFCIFGAPMGFIWFVKSFVTKGLHELLGTISNFFMLANLQVNFVMFSLCYA
jgi:hypothetical protein